MKKLTISKASWPINVTIITFCLAILFSYLSQIAATKSDLFVQAIILVLMIFTSILFDAIAVSVTSCDLDRLKLLIKDDIMEYNIAAVLVKNAEKVNNICADVVGDMCGILAGACGATIVAHSSLVNYQSITAISLSSFIVAFTVGGKALLKDWAVNSAEEFLISVVKALKIFVRKKK